MKKNFNIIQIKGVKGILLAIFVISCLFAGFIVFPGWVAMQLWNLITNYIPILPIIGLFQGLILWGILAISYFLLRKEKVIVCMKSPQGLSDEELKSVFADIKRHTMEDPILHAMVKARESELKMKSAEQNAPDTDKVANSDSSKI